MGADIVETQISIFFSRHNVEFEHLTHRMLKIENQRDADD